MPYERVMVFGFTGFKGTMDDGKTIDSGKVLILRPLKSSSNRDDSFKVGQFTQEFPLGSLALALKHVGDVSRGFAPREMEANFELVSTGKRAEVVVTDLRSCAPAKQAA
jgi:hypothetical protein